MATNLFKREHLQDVSGEYVRQGVVETQAGLDLALDLQVVDTETCAPITGAYLEIWHYNSTGVYSSVRSGGNYETAPENFNSTFLRGAQQTDGDGAVHNGTIRSTTATHVSQIFLGQDLIYQVEELSPYTTNTQDLTTNVQDGILEDIAETSDPFADYVLLGNSVGDGLFSGQHCQRRGYLLWGRWCRE
ncbi:hypothetical protein QQZ08_000223 [Neonectria magnoliae]|uniref:Intradiol ring-cleavage dioxygenases domain-containing protein n=1 Tax=Neonectria magnoliae TaxID=2732573 RepID=A0ABR1IJK8_9HYPO